MPKKINFSSKFPFSFPFSHFHFLISIFSFPKRLLAKLNFLISIFPFLLFILLIFRSWFFSLDPVVGGDSGYLFKENIKELPSQLFLWQGSSNLGRLNLYRWTTPYSGAVSFIASIFNISWPVLTRIFWLWPFLVLSIFSSWYLIKQIFGKNSLFYFPFSIFLFVSNTYILMIAAGGQRGILLAYSLAPLVLGRFIRQLTSSRVNGLKTSSRVNGLKSKKVKELRSCLVTGLILAVQVMFDLRIAYVTLIACGLYVFYQWYLRKFSFSFLISHFSFLISILIILGLHSYWLLPMVMNKSIGAENLGEAYTTAKAVKYFSFAQFSNTISLLHPNWPENIFGETYFMRAEFLLIPILAYGSLLFIKQLTSSRVNGLRNSLINNSLINNKIILYFNLLGLVGAFLAKGANPPLGGVYLWLFENFPGMIMFRDPTKFYLLTALSYSVLIPFSVFQIYLFIKKLTGSRVNEFKDKKD